MKLSVIDKIVSEYICGYFKRNGNISVNESTTNRRNNCGFIILQETDIAAGGLSVSFQREQVSKEITEKREIETFGEWIKSLTF